MQEIIPGRDTFKRAVSEPHRLERLAMAIVDLVRGIESQRPLNGCHAIFTHVDARLDVARDDLAASVVLIAALVYVI